MVPLHLGRVATRLELKGFLNISIQLVINNSPMVSVGYTIMYSSTASFCKPQYKYEEENIQKVVLGDGWYIYNDDDHSKFGISVSSDSKNMVCSVDLNRAYSQNSRGGGYVCFDELTRFVVCNQ